MSKKALLTTKQYFRAAPVALVALGFSAPVLFAATERQLDAHDHGHAQINMAISGQEVLAELITPAANVIGFEHEPENEEQEKALTDASSMLARGEELLIFNASAECALQSSRVESELLEDADHDHGHSHDEDKHDDEHHDGDKHEDHDDEHHDGDKHEDHDDEHHDGDKHDDDHHGEEKHDEHDHDGEGKHDDDHDDEHKHDDHEGHEDTHSEFHATWTYSCAHPEKLESIQVKLFENFGGFEEIDVSVAGESAQGSFELSPGAAEIKL